MHDQKSLPPDEFIATLDSWTNTGGMYPDRIAYGQVPTTSEEVHAISRALRSSHIYDAKNYTAPLFNLVCYFQQVELPPVILTIRAEGLPAIRAILNDALAGPPADHDDNYDHRDDAQLMALRVLLQYVEPGDGDLLVSAARLPHLAGDFHWSGLFDMVAQGPHPDLRHIVDNLRNPLPESFAGVAFLDLCNGLSHRDAAFRNPFASPAGVARLIQYLKSNNEEEFSYAVSATVTIPSLSAADRDALLKIASAHPSPLVQLEAAWAAAKIGQAGGAERLAAFAADPNYSERAMAYLEELGLQRHAPPSTREPNFVAMSEMSRWLAHPMEIGRPPDHISLYDTRLLFWPPTNDRRRLWLFHYRYDSADGPEGIGLVGSTTFALFGEATAGLSPEDVYGLHCAWELEMDNDERAPDKRTAASGRKLLAAANPGFPA